MARWATVPQSGCGAGGARISADQPHDRSAGGRGRGRNGRGSWMVCSRSRPRFRRSISTMHWAPRCFEAICELPEYYLTRTERAIFAAHSRHDRSGRRPAGASSSIWAPATAPRANSGCLHLQPRRYIAVDIAAPAIEPALSRLAAAHPEIEFTGVVTDFSRKPRSRCGARRRRQSRSSIPGSSIGNFAPDEALELLSADTRTVRAAAAGC